MNYHNMSGFVTKQLTKNERVCWRLRAAREAAGMSLEFIADQTKINPRYLLALEECRFNDIPFSALYQKNFIKKYAIAVGADPEEYVSQYFVEEIAPEPTMHIKQKSRFFFTAWPALVRGGLFTLAGLAVIFYLGQQVHKTIAPPALALIGPDNGFISRDNTITLRGKSEPATKIMVNGQTIKSDDHGDFSEAIALSPGVNTIVIEAQKKHGKTTQIVRHIVYKENTAFSLQTNVLDTKN
jgi:transcriptional regulator with XRE-family HTH domain